VANCSGEAATPSTYDVALIGFWTFVTSHVTLPGMNDETITSSHSTTRMTRVLSLTSKVLFHLIPFLGILVTLSMVSYPLLGRDLWTDEAYTVSYTSHPTISGLLDDVRKNEETPPVYFITVWLWSRAFGTDEIAVRTLSVLYGAGAVVGTALLARHYLRRAANLVATVALAMAPLLSSYMVEARCYTLTVLLTVVCMATFERLYHRPESRWAQVGYALSAAALFLTSYFSVALLVAHWLIWLIHLRNPAIRRSRLFAWMLIQVIITTCILPWLPSLYYQVTIASDITTPVVYSSQDFALQWLSIIIGLYKPTQYLRMCVICTAVGGILIAATALSPKAMANGLVIRTLVLPAVLLLILLSGMQAVMPRYVMMMLPGFALAVGAGFEAIRRRWSLAAWLLASIFLVGTLTSFSIDPGRPTFSWSKLSAKLAKKAMSGQDIVIFYPPWDQRVFEYYYRGPALPLIGAHNYDDFFHVAKRPYTRGLPSAEALQLIGTHRRVWAFYRGGISPETVLTPTYRTVQEWGVNNVYLILYERNAP